MILTFFRIPGHTKDLPKDIDQEARRRRRLVAVRRGPADGPLVTPSSGIYVPTVPVPTYKQIRI